MRSGCQTVHGLAICSLSGYNPSMIKTFRHKGLEVFFRTGSKAGIQPHHAVRLQIQLTALNMAKQPEDMNAPGWRLHPLGRDLAGHWSVWVNGNWRVTFKFDGTDVGLVDYQDYH
jgi:proteic killer suppression protein